MRCKKRISPLFLNFTGQQKISINEIPLHWAKIAYVWVYKGKFFFFQIKLDGISKKKKIEKLLQFWYKSKKKLY